PIVVEEESLIEPIPENLEKSHLTHSSTFSTIEIVDTDKEDCKNFRKLSKVHDTDEYKHNNDYEGTSLLPLRLFSLRNVIAISNIIINFIAIFVISLVAYFASFESTNSAVSIMAQLTVRDIKLKLENSLASAEQYNIFTEDNFKLNSIPMNETDSALRHLLFTFSQHKVSDIDQIYIVSPDNLYNGVGRIKSRTTISPNLVIKFINSTDKPFREQYIINEPCGEENYYCSKRTPRTFLSNSSYIVNSRPYFKKAVLSKKPGWTDIYSFASFGVLGFTSVRPIYEDLEKNRLQFVAAVDITLSSLSLFLQNVTRSISENRPNNEGLLLWIIERKTGFLVATSEPGSIKLYNRQLSETSDVIRIRATDSENQVLKSAMESVSLNMKQEFKEQDSMNVYRNGRNLIVASKYSSFSDDIDWVIIMNIPIEIFQYQLNRTYLTNIPLVTSIVFLASIMMSVIVTRYIGKPLKAITEQMLQVANLDFNLDSDSPEPDEENQIDEMLKITIDGVTKNYSFNELEEKGKKKENSQAKEKQKKSLKLKEVRYLESAMSSMTSALRSFSRYVPVDVVTLLIMFTDIANFTSITEKISPNQLVVLMGEYFSEISGIILESQGIVDKYIGDAVMAFWNAPLSLENHPVIACHAALQCQKRLHELQKRWLKQGFPLIETRIGINTGNALVGNFGAPNRLNYTCIGDSVNLASRLEGLNKLYGTKIIISEFTYERVRPYFVCRPLDRVAVKGKTKA
ncbi:hypothetical protein ROZALSC1DRAFT_27251, partial [Rozella allomycis CSF55]